MPRPGAANTRRGESPQQSINGTRAPFCAGWERSIPWPKEAQRERGTSASGPSPATADNTPIGRAGSPQAGTLPPASRYSAISAQRHKKRSWRRCKRWRWPSMTAHTPRPQSSPWASGLTSGRTTTWAASSTTPSAFTRGTSKTISPPPWAVSGFPICTPTLSRCL